MLQSVDAIFKGFLLLFPFSTSAAEACTLTSLVALASLKDALCQRQKAKLTDANVMAGTDNHNPLELALILTTTT